MAPAMLLGLGPSNAPNLSKRSTAARAKGSDPAATSSSTPAATKSTSGLFRGMPSDALDINMRFKTDSWGYGECGGYGEDGEDQDEMNGKDVFDPLDVMSPIVVSKPRKAKCEYFYFIE